MDYTKIPRDLIYRERRSLEEFAEEQEENVLFIDNMLDSYYFSSADGKERALRCFNTAYYLCTLILLSDKHPDWNFSLYCDIAYCGDRINKVHQSFTLSLVYIFLTHTYYEVPCKKFLDKLDIFFVNYKNALVKNDPFLKDYTYKDVCNDLLKNTPDDLLIAEEFKPRVIDRECIDDVMSDREFNWVKFTNYWKERNVREIVGALGITEDEKHNVVEMLRQSSHGFYSAGCNDNPEQVDAMLNNIDEEIRLQFNSEAEQALVEAKIEELQNQGDVRPLQARIAELEKEQKEKNELLEAAQQRIKELGAQVEELQQKVAGCDNRQMWVDWLDNDVFDSKIRAEEIYKKLCNMSTPHLSDRPRCYVLFRVMSVIGGLKKNASQKDILKWWNAHFNCGWQNDNQFRFTDLPDIIRNERDISRWGKCDGRNAKHYHAFAQDLIEELAWNKGRGEYEIKQIFLK